MKLQVRDKEFEITFVNNYVRERYQDILSLSDDISDLHPEIEEIKEKDLSKSELSKAVRAVDRKRTALIRSIADNREDILKELLSTNGYEFDKRWWDHKTDANDLNGFILDCIMKDVNANGSKKK